MSPVNRDWRVALSLAPGEARRIVRSAAFLLFLPLSVFALMAANAADAEKTIWSQASISVALGLVPLGWCLIALTDLAVLRDKRHGVDTMTATMPAAEAARTGGHLLGGLVGVPIGAVLLGIAIVIEEQLSDPSGTPDLLELAVPLFIVAGAAVLGVALGRWLPWALVSAPTIIATIFLASQFRDLRVSRVRFLGFATNPTSTSLPALEVRPRLLHLVWLAAWIGLTAVVALARHVRGLRLAVVAGVLGVVAIVAGIAQTRPLDDETASARAGFLNQPSMHQRCETVAEVDYCAYPHNEVNLDRWQRMVAQIQSHLPPPARGRNLVVSQRLPWMSGNPNCGQSQSLDLIDETISARVSVNDAWPADGHVHPGIVKEQLPCGGTTLDGLFTGVQIGAWAVGLPPAQWGRGQTCAADGQARAVVAIWLGTLDGGRLDTYVDDVVTDLDAPLDHSSWNNPPPWGVDWHPRDLIAALAITTVPTEQVDVILAAHWNEFVDPSTPTTRLLELVGLDPGDAPANPRDTCPPSRAL